MKIAQMVLPILGLALLSGCTVSRGDCEFMLQTDRERCLHANASSEQALRERSKAMHKDDQPFTIQKDKVDESRSTSRAP